MKAIYIQNLFDPTTDLQKLNDELKNSHTILNNYYVNSNELPGGIVTQGHILIVDDNVDDKVESKDTDELMLG